MPRGHNALYTGVEVEGTSSRQVGAAGTGTCL